MARKLAETRLGDKTAGAVFTNVFGAAKAALDAEVNRASLYYQAQQRQVYATPNTATKTVAISSTVLFGALFLLYFLTRRG